MALRYKWKYLHAKQSLSEILTGSLCNCLLEIETLNQQFQKYNQTNELIKKKKNYEFNSKPFNTNTFAYQNPNSESIKKKKKNLRFIWLGWIGFEALERDYASLRRRNEIAQISNPKRRRELLRHLLHLLP